MALLVVGVLLVSLYVNPARTYWSTWQEARTKRSDVAELQREKHDLLRRKAALQRPQSIELEARRLGMVRRDERAFAVDGLPRR